MEHQLTDGQRSSEQEEMVNNAVDSMLPTTRNYRSIQYKLEEDYSIELSIDDIMDIVDNRMAMQ